MDMQDVYYFLLIFIQHMVSLTYVYVVQKHQPHISHIRPMAHCHSSATENTQHKSQIGLVKHLTEN